MHSGDMIVMCGLSHALGTAPVEGCRFIQRIGVSGCGWIILYFDMVVRVGWNDNVLLESVACEMLQDLQVMSARYHCQQGGVLKHLYFYDKVDSVAE